MTSPHLGRRTRRYRETSAVFRTNCEHVHMRCWLCGKPIDYTLAHPHPESFAVDHAQTVRDRPDLAEDPANYRPSHKVCNERRGHEAPHFDLGVPSEVW